MESVPKRARTSRKEIIEDIASLMEDIGETVASIGKSTRIILKANAAAVLYHAQLLHAECPTNGLENIAITNSGLSQERDSENAWRIDSAQGSDVSSI